MLWLLFKGEMLMTGEVEFNAVFRLESLAVVIFALTLDAVFGRVLFSLALSAGMLWSDQRDLRTFSPPVGTGVAATAVGGTDGRRERAI
jgi:hypothetical protein